MEGDLRTQRVEPSQGTSSNGSVEDRLALGSQRVTSCTSDYLDVWHVVFMIVNRNSQKKRQRLRDTNWSVQGHIMSKKQTWEVRVFLPTWLHIVATVTCWSESFSHPKPPLL